MPVSLGLLRPVIILPRGLAQTIEHGPLEALILHETAHIARRDPWVGVAQRIGAQ